ncbi:MAG: trehalose-phosphatase [Thermodesulfobacteriota bacterium]
MDREIESILAAVTALPQGRRLLLFLDYDGTLVEIAPRPELARPAPQLIQVLTRLISLLSQAVVVVSGRPLADLQELLPIPGLNYLGCHGAQGLLGGRPWNLEVPGGSKEEQEELAKQLTRNLTGLEGWWLEIKPSGFALHYRQAQPEEERRIMAVLEPWLRQVVQGGRHQVLRGKKVVEILPQGVSKGAAIRKILVLPQFSGLFPVYLGDDVTDETAFQALQGRGLTVKVGDTAAASAAPLSLANPEKVRQFLALLAEHLEDGR